MRGPRIALVLASMSLATGCASTLSGVGGNEVYACKAPEGVLCTSIAGVYANSVENNLPSQRVDKRPAVPLPQAASVGTAPISGSATDAASIRSPARVLRLWIAPWEDADGDLRDQSYLYVVVDSGRWLIEHRRSAIRNAFTPVAPPKAAPPAPSGASSASAREPASLPRAGGAWSPSAGTAAPRRDNQDVE